MCSSHTLLWNMPNFHHCWKPSPLQAHWGRWCHTSLVCPACLSTVCVKSTPHPLSHGACRTLATVASLPLSKHTGGYVTTSTSSGQLAYLRFMWGSAPPYLWWSMLHFSHCYNLPISKVGVQEQLLLPSPAGLFIYSLSGDCSSPNLQSAGRPFLLAMCISFQLLVYYLVCFFPFFQVKW
jgi:hypothetical protein